MASVLQNLIQAPRNTADPRVASTYIPKKTRGSDGVLYALNREEDRGKYRTLSEEEIMEEIRISREMSTSLKIMSGKLDSSGRSRKPNSGKFIPPTMGTNTKQRKIEKRAWDKHIAAKRTQTATSISMGNNSTTNSTQPSEERLMKAVNDMQEKYTQNLSVIETLLAEREQMERRVRSLEKAVEESKLQASDKYSESAAKRRLNKTTPGVVEGRGLDLDLHDSEEDEGIQRLAKTAQGVYGHGDEALPEGLDSPPPPPYSSSPTNSDTCERLYYESDQSEGEKKEIYVKAPTSTRPRSKSAHNISRGRGSSNTRISSTEHNSTTQPATVRMNRVRKKGKPVQTSGKSKTCSEIDSRHRGARISHELEMQRRKNDEKEAELKRLQEGIPGRDRLWHSEKSFTVNSSPTNQGIDTHRKNTTSLRNKSRDVPVEKQYKQQDSTRAEVFLVNSALETEKRRRSKAEAASGRRENDILDSETVNRLSKADQSRTKLVYPTSDGTSKKTAKILESLTDIPMSIERSEHDETFNPNKKKPKSSRSTFR